jgi:hypothetical protein
MKSKILVRCSLQLLPLSQHLLLPAVTAQHLPTGPRSAHRRRSEARVRRLLRLNATMRSAPSMIRTVVSLRHRRRLASVSQSSLLAVCTQATDLKLVS